MNREELLRALGGAEAYVHRFSSDYLSQGVSGKIWNGLRTYRLRYVRYLLARTGLFGRWPVSVRTFWGEEMRVPLQDSDALGPYLFGMLSGECESRLARYFIRTTTDQTVFYDVGANYGFFSLLVSSLSDQVRVYAFEPNPITARFTRDILAVRSGQVVLTGAAVGDHDGPTEFFDKTGGLHSGGSTLSAEAVSAHPERFQKIQVPMVTLDAFCKTHPIPTLIKIDVDGGENVVLDGAEQLLKRNRPAIALEVWGEDFIRVSAERAVHRLQGLGYRIHRIDSAGNLVAMDRIDFDTDLGKDLYDNFVFLPV